MRLPAARARRNSRSVQSRAASASRQTGWLDGIAGAATREAIAQAEFVLAMEGGAARDLCEDAGETLIVIDQQVAGR